MLLFYTTQEVYTKLGAVSYHKALLRLFRNINLIRRKRVVKNYSTFLHAAFLYLVHQYSFRRLALYMACCYHVSMSDTA